jgi:hypothetical protein
MGTQRVQMKGVLPWLVRWARSAGKRDFYPALAALFSPVKKKFLRRTLFQFMCPHRIATWQADVQGHLSLIVWSPVLVYSKQYILYSL